MSRLTAEVQDRDGRCAIHLSGYLSGESAPQLEAAFEQAAAEQILLVFEAQTLISSAGLAVLFDLILPVQEKGAQVRIVESAAHFRRAFQLTGARTVVMSLWSVLDKETATLMTDFYGRLSDGKSRALQDALRAQMQARRAKYGAAHPFYWGAFVSVGQP